MQKPKPATISLRISSIVMPTYFTPIPREIKYCAAQIASAGGRLFKIPVMLAAEVSINGPRIDAPNMPIELAIFQPAKAQMLSIIN